LSAWVAKTGGELAWLAWGKWQMVMEKATTLEPTGGEGGPCSDPGLTVQNPVGVGRAKTGKKNIHEQRRERA